MTHTKTSKDHSDKKHSSSRRSNTKRNYTNISSNRRYYDDRDYIYKYNKWGYDIYGYDKLGYDIYGYNINGFKKYKKKAIHPKIIPSKPTCNVSVMTDNISNNINKIVRDNIIKLPVLNNHPMMSSFMNFNLNNEEKKEEEVIEKSDIIDDSDYEYKCLNRNVDSLQDLIDLGILYETEYKDMEYRFNIDIRTISKMLEPLIELNNMIGLNDIKTEIVEQILFHLQKLDNGNNDMLHTVIYGPPGVGKTEIAKLLGRIYKDMNILSKGTVRSVKRADLIGKFLGETSIKTKKVLDECKGGVLFIDEAYSLGNPEQRDSYSRECIDCITSYLTENKRDFMCIIAGYKKSLDNCFFAYNEGLRSRFPTQYEIKPYLPVDLCLIFKKMVLDNNWSFENDTLVLELFFEENKDTFKYNGRDMETLLNRVKIAHAKRVLCIQPEYKKIITCEDIQNGFNLYKSKLIKKSTFINDMYI